MGVVRLFIFSVIALFCLHSWWILSVLFISLAFTIRSNINCSTPYGFNLYGNAYIDVKYMNVGMNRLDIISILALEEEFWTILKIADMDTESASKFEVNDDHIDFLFIDSSKRPHTMSFNVKGTTRVYYEDIDYILIHDEAVGLSITLPLKYSNRYKALAD